MISGKLFGVRMKRNNKKAMNSRVGPNSVESEAAIAAATANYANGDILEVSSEFVEESGGKSFYRLPRRLNSGFLKTISRKLPCLNHRRSSGSPRESAGFSSSDLSHSQTDISCSPSLNVVVEKRSNSSSRQSNKVKSRVMPSPIRFPLCKSNAERINNEIRKPSVSLISENNCGVDCSGEMKVAEVVPSACTALAPATPIRLSLNSPKPAVEAATTNYFEIFYRDVPQPRSLTMELYRLAKYGWYWGPISRSEAEERLHGQPDGAFLVRDSSDDRYLLSLSFRSFDKTLHTRIEHCNGMFSFYVQPETESHASVVELIEHSMSHSQIGVFCYSKARIPGAPSYPVRLTKPVSRFTQVRSLQYLCRFVIRQYTRVDLIQDLPLPNRIKGYIKEAHY